MHAVEYTHIALPEAEHRTPEREKERKSDDYGVRLVENFLLTKTSTYLGFT